ncbi:gamma-glutamylcyclotransferase [Pseudoalteromonas sp. S4498]|uniref:gamma-glutamylcyclotransferase family protein n=2 Tax=Pseudoalteromonas TaxID=53246 RepID=UPI001108E5BB|nr:gamma-glutamylcyclotransferase [Pseudoalteromonas galatheae]
MMQALFSYGTLQQEQVQLDTFGRRLEGEKTVLCGFKVGQVKITDPAVIISSQKDIHPILIATGNVEDEVEGTVFLITKAELAHADEYEVDDYQRISATLSSGKTCWIYSAAPNAQLI